MEWSHTVESGIKLADLNWGNAASFYRDFFYSFDGMSYAEYNESLVGKIYDLSSTTPYMYYALKHMGLKPCNSDPELFSYYESAQKRKTETRQKIKPGRFIKKHMPWVSNEEIESFVKEYKNSMKPREYDLIYSKEESGFIEAYTGKQVRGTTPSFGGFPYEIKELSCSCMGKSFEYLPKHPAAAYASGDFAILYAKEKETGLIGARVIIGNDSVEYIYSQCDFATRVLCDWLEKNQINPDSNWAGLSLKAIAFSGDEYLMPYVDGYSEFSFEEESIVVGGNITFSGTGGIIRLVEQTFCGHCEEFFYSDDSDTGLDRHENEVTLCPYCRRSYYTYSYFQETYIHDSIAREVNNGVATESWLSENGYVCDVDGDYILENESVLYNGEYYHTSHREVTCFEGEYYHEDSDELRGAQERKEKEDSAYEIKVSYSWVWESIDNKWHWLEYKAEKTRELRHNYELTENGPIQIPTLPGIEWDSLNNNA